MIAKGFIFSKVLLKNELLRRYFSNILISKEGELFFRTPLGDCFCLVSTYIDFLFCFKNIIRDGFYQRGVDLRRVKRSAIFVLIATLISC